MIQDKGARSNPIGWSPPGGPRLVGSILSLLLVFALAVEAIPSTSEGDASDSLAAPAEELPLFTLSSSTSPRGSLPAPTDPRAGGLQRRALAVHLACERDRLAGERPPPVLWTGHRKRPERRTTSTSTDDAH